jgi:RNA polymerase sigma-70 factor, ECF subfamily
VRNTAFTWLAKNRPKSVVVTDDDGLFERASLEMIDRSHAATPEAVLIAKVDTEQLHRAIAALPLAYREALVLREIEGLSYQEISSVMSIPSGPSCRGWRAPATCSFSGSGWQAREKPGAA